MNLQRIISICCTFLLLGLGLVHAQENTLDSLVESNATPSPLPLSTGAKIYQFKLHEAIFPAAWRTVKKAMEEAEQQEVDYIVLHLNTYGGAVDMADSISKKILDAKATTVVLVDNNAASAGALISLSCDSLFMVQAASIGAATVVNQTGEQAPDKYQSYMRSKMRAVAEAKGRDPMIAEAMVDDRIVIPGIIDSAKTLTFTTTEAIKHGFCDGQFNNVEDVIKHLSDAPQIISYSSSWTDRIVQFLLHPMVSSLLMLVIFFGIYGELQTPGVGFPIMAAISAGVLYFAPHYIDGLAQHWEIALFVVGLVLLAIEVFVIPGFGVAGVLGIIALVAGLTLSLLRNDFLDFSIVDLDMASSALLRVLLSIGGSILMLILLGGKLMESPSFKKMILEETQDKSEGYSVKSAQYVGLVGKKGVAITDLRLAGKIEIDGERYDAVTSGSYIDAGTEIIVTSYKENSLTVQSIT